MAAQVQRAVFKLSQSGSQLEAGDLQGASATLSEPWVSDFGATGQLFTVQPATVMEGLDKLRSLTASNDGSGSKRQFVAVVADIKAWVEQAGFSGKLKGL